MRLRPRLEALAGATGALSPKQVRLVGGLLDRIDAEHVRVGAILTVAALLNPDGALSDWQVALRLERALLRFKATARKRIVAGQPPTPYEELLWIITGPPRSFEEERRAGCACSARRLHDVLKGDRAVD